MKKLEQSNYFRTNIEKNSEILEQTVNLLFPLNSENIILRNSWKLLHAQTNYYFNQVQYLIQENTALEKLCSITQNDGIYCWRREGNDYISSHVVDAGSQHNKGVVSVDGILIMAGYIANNVKIYNITKDTPPTFNLLSTHPHTNYILSCFLHNYENAICSDWAGYSKKYNLHTLQQSDFYYSGGKGIYSGIQTMDKLVILGGLDEGKIYILDEYGNQINTHSFSSIASIFEITEVRRNILLTANAGSGCYLHNIQDPYNIPDSIHLITGDRYSTVISLKSNEGDFAIGGWRNSGDKKGFVDIYHLFEDYTLMSIKTYIIETINCDIYTIKELRTKIIVFGGDSDCEVICLWNYAAWPEQDPVCWNDKTADYIIDFIALPE